MKSLDKRFLNVDYALRHYNFIEDETFIGARSIYTKKFTEEENVEILLIACLDPFSLKISGQVFINSVFTGIENSFSCSISKLKVGNIATIENFVLHTCQENVKSYEKLKEF